MNRLRSFAPSDKNPHSPDERSLWTDERCVSLGFLWPWRILAPALGGIGGPGWHGVTLWVLGVPWCPAPLKKTGADKCARLRQVPALWPWVRRVSHGPWVAPCGPGSCAIPHTIPHSAQGGAANPLIHRALWPVTIGLKER